MHQRYKLRCSIVITSNRVAQIWDKYLGEATIAAAILDGLMHRCAMLELEGKSYRFNEAAARMTITPELGTAWKQCSRRSCRRPRLLSSCSIENGFVQGGLYRGGECPSRMCADNN